MPLKANHSSVRLINTDAASDTAVKHMSSPDPACVADGCSTGASARSERSLSSAALPASAYFALNGPSPARQDFDEPNIFADERHDHRVGPAIGLASGYLWGRATKRPSPPPHPPPPEPQPGWHTGQRFFFNFFAFFSCFFATNTPEGRNQAKTVDRDLRLERGVSPDACQWQEATRLNRRGRRVSLTGCDPFA